MQVRTFIEVNNGSKVFQSPFGGPVTLTPYPSGFMAETRPTGWGDLISLERDSESYMALFSNGETHRVTKVTQSHWTLDAPLPPPPTIKSIPSATLLTGGKSVTRDLSYTCSGPATITAYNTPALRVVRQGNNLVVTSTNASGRHMVTVTVTDQWGRSASTTMIVNVPRVPTLSNFAAQTIERGKQKNLGFKWSVNDGSPSFSLTTSNSSVVRARLGGSGNSRYVTIIGQGIGYGRITLTLKDRYGQRVSRSITVTVKSPPRKWVHPLETIRGWTTYDDSANNGSHWRGAVDIPCGPGNTPPLRSACNGTVLFAGWEDGFSGNAVIVTPDGGSGEGVVYVHMSRVATRAGARVSAGQYVGNVGATGKASGEHLHLEIRVRGTIWGNFIPAVKYFKDRGVTI